MDFTDVLNEFTKPDFVDRIIKELNIIFNDINVANQFLFKNYNKLVTDVKAFKDSLLEFVLDAQAHLIVLTDNMASARFQQQTEEEQLRFIKQRLHGINRKMMQEFIKSCIRLIETSEALYKEYGTTMFKVKYIVLNTVGFAAIGAAVAFTVGLALPFLSVIEACVGGGLGATIGLGFASYELVWKWDERMVEIENIRTHLQRIRVGLIEVEQQLGATYIEVKKTKLELKHQIRNDSYLTIQDLHRYINATYDQFVNLQNILSHLNLVAEND